MGHENTITVIGEDGTVYNVSSVGPGGIEMGSEQALGFALMQGKLGRGFGQVQSGFAALPLEQRQKDPAIVRAITEAGQRSRLGGEGPFNPGGRAPNQRKRTAKQISRRSPQQSDVKKHVGLGSRRIP